MRLLVIEDAKSTQLIIRGILAADYDLTFADTLAEARACLAENTFNLILLDVELPDGIGFDLLTELVETHPDLPVLLITARTNTTDKLMGFSLGAEDYISKPFEPLELKARVDIRLRRKTKASNKDLLVLGEMTLLIPQQQVQIHEATPIELTPLEFKLLYQFATHVDHVLSRDQLINAVWGSKVTVIDRTIDTHICNLRRKLGEISYEIKAVLGEGYRFKKRAKQRKSA